MILGTKSCKDFCVHVGKQQHFTQSYAKTSKCPEEESAIYLLMAVSTLANIHI